MKGLRNQCIQCMQKTNHSVLKEEELYFSDENWWEERRYQIVKCLGCDKITFRKIYRDISMDHPEFSDDEWDVELFSKKSIFNIFPKKFPNTPKNLIKIYHETLEAFNSAQPILCSAGLRAIIEGMCKEKGIDSGEVTNPNGKPQKRKTLEGKINGLAEEGFLTKNNADTLHELRFLGNKALHELTPPSNIDLEIAIKIVEHILENVYELQQNASILKSKREKGKKKE